ncbi:hypothetical protein P7C73_g3835, partial [Tremellales sp. Uapishka_1]
MDQDAFRSLLSAPRSAASAGPSRTLGAPAPKRGWGLKVKDGYDKHPKKDKEEKKDGDAPKFQPRNTVKKGKYQDRAEMRRQGVEDEYKPVEKLLEDFEKRKAEAGEDVEKVEAQRAYLGGDATHSILVKGLDFALLAARKAELEREGEVNMEDELEQLGKNITGGKGKTKEESKVDKEEGPRKGFKSITKKADAGGEGVDGKTKKKKKKKKVKVEETLAMATEPSAPTTDSKEDRPEKTAEKPLGKPPLPPAPPIKDESSDEDVDIFGDVGEYDLNVGGDEESEDEKMDVDEEGQYEGRSGREG